MSRNKNLNDVIHGDRAIIRGYETTLQPDAVTSWFDSGAHKAVAVSNYVDEPRKTTTVTEHSLGQRCYHTHPALALPGTTHVVYGGSCFDPVVKDADVYVGLDGGMKTTRKAWPWTPGHEVLFPIPDMGVPADAAAFKSLISWLSMELNSGHKVHVGCIGGHGRTGMVLAALVSLRGEKDAITYVRKNYCPKAVESKAQVRFLSEHFGILPAKGAKEYTAPAPSYHEYSRKTSSNAASARKDKGLEFKYHDPVASKPKTTGTSLRTFSALADHGSIWAKAKAK